MESGVHGPGCGWQERGVVRRKIKAAEGSLDGVVCRLFVYFYTIHSVISFLFGGGVSYARIADSYNFRQRMTAGF